MTSINPEHPSSGHLSLEEIATLVDRSTGAVERQRLLGHVSSCEECYELFAETARLVHGGHEHLSDSASSTTGDAEFGKVVRRGPWGRRVGWAGAVLAAASIALLVLTPLGDFLRSRNEILPVADLAAPLVRTPEAGEAIAENWQDHGWPTMLGAPVDFGPEEQRSFRLGVRVFELEVALSTGRRELAEGLTYRIESLVAADELSGTLNTYYAGAEGIREGLRTGRPADQLIDLARQADALLGPDPETGAPGFADPFWYAFGKWAQAARIAALTGISEHFRSAAHRRFLDQLRQAELPPAVAPIWERIDELLRRKDAPDEALADALTELIRRAGGG